MIEKKAIVLAVCILLLSSSVVTAKKVLFYEIDVPNDYTKDSGYSKLRDKLVSMGYDIAAISKGKLSRDTLESYDIMIIHASQQLSTDEIATIVWFVSSKGGGLMVAGGTPEKANRLMPIFGMTMDDGTLIDFTNSITTKEKPVKENSNFEVTRFSNNNLTRFMRLGVNKVGFYEGHGLILSGDARMVASGDADTYSDTLSFPSGSEPPIIAASLFGNGLAVGLGDADMLSNEYIDQYDNMAFASNMIDWLSTTRMPTTKNASQVETEIIINQCNLERVRLETNVDNLKTKVSGLDMSTNVLSDELATCTIELYDIKQGKIGPFTRNQLAIIIAGLFALMGGMLFSGKKKPGKSAGGAKEGEDILSELGYEFETEGNPKESGEGGGGQAEDLAKELDGL